ncbi:SET domain-containing protein [Candidatus Dependentiae bacterium]|nr:SET domain-containing protein [Candidatus Dependentiae bacterium]
MKRIFFLSLMLNLKVFCDESHTRINEFSFVLKPSLIAGVGIFAAHDIAKGTKIVFFPEGYQHRMLPKKDIPEEFLKYCVAKTEEVWVAPHKFDHMEIAWYLNHSVDPNIKRAEPGSCYSLRDIQKGEEILINYNDFNEPENTKEEYFKPK